MAFHKSNLGSFGANLQSDMDGYVPEADDDPWQFSVDHAERTHDESGELTEYGQWWEDEGFPEWRDEAVAATERSIAALTDWQES